MAALNLTTLLNLMKERISLSRIVSQDVTLHKKGREYVGCCPFHNEKTGSFFVNDDKGTFHCFGCGASGDVLEYIMKKRGIQFMQAVDVLSDISGIKIPETVDKTDRHIVDQQKLLLKALEFFKLSFNSEALRYCESRGITQDLREKFSIGYAPLNGDLLLSYLKKSGFSMDSILDSGVFSQKDGRILCRFRDRIIFPLMNRKGWPIAFGGRGIRKDASPKYINSPESPLFHKKENLYGYNLAMKSITSSNPFILVEGYMDVVMMHKFGYYTTVASMGTAFSPQHLSKLWKYCNDPIVCLDGDQAGHNAMVKIAFMAMPYLQPGKSLRFCSIPGGHDPDSFLKEHSKPKMDELISQSAYLIDFIWRHFIIEYDTLDSKNPEKIAQWKKNIFSHIEEIQNQDIKTLYKNDIKTKINNLLYFGNKIKAIQNTKNTFDFHIDRSEKIVLREASLLYILVVRPSVISSVIEELATVDFSNRDFDKLKNFMVEKFSGLPFDLGEYQEIVRTIELMVSAYCDCDGMTDDEVVEFWRNIFTFGVSNERIANDLKIAKDECKNSLDVSTWGRLKALKLDFLRKKK